jgi:hypothetical protein
MIFRLRAIRMTMNQKTQILAIRAILRKKNALIANKSDQSDSSGISSFENMRYAILSILEDEAYLEPICLLRGEDKSLRASLSTNAALTDDQGISCAKMQWCGLFEATNEEPVINRVLMISSYADDGRFTKQGKSRAPTGSGSIVRSQYSADIFLHWPRPQVYSRFFLLNSSFFFNAYFGTSPVSKA